jgi:hypothetical protein
MSVCAIHEGGLRSGVMKALVDCLAALSPDATVQCTANGYDAAWNCVDGATHAACTAGDSEPIVLCGQIIAACSQVTEDQCLASFHALKPEYRVATANCMKAYTGQTCGDDAWACYPVPQT